MNSFIVLLVLAQLFQSGLGFYLQAGRAFSSFSKLHNAVDRGSGSGDDYDTSEMVAMSSSEIAALKKVEMLKAEEENAAIQDTIKKNVELAEQLKSDPKASIKMPEEPAKESKAVAFPAESASSAIAPADDNKALPLSAGNSGFDLGLLIAFPVIVGTLALFFLFPFLGEKLAGGSGPLDPDMIKGM